MLHLFHGVEMFWTEEHDKYSLTSFPLETATAKASKKENSDVRMFNISNLSNFEIVKESLKPAQPLPAIDLEKIERRTKSKIRDKRFAVSRVGVDVTPEGQKLFDVIAKQ